MYSGHVVYIPTLVFYDVLESNGQLKLFDREGSLERSEPLPLARHQRVPLKVVGCIYGSYFGIRAFSRT